MTWDCGVQDGFTRKQGQDIISFPFFLANQKNRFVIGLNFSQKKYSVRYVWFVRCGLWLSPYNPVKAYYQSKHEHWR